MNFQDVWPVRVELPSAVLRRHLLVAAIDGEVVLSLRRGFDSLFVYRLPAARAASIALFLLTASIARSYRLS